jgi:Bacteriocin-protection, YdeI or OmpD-Associated/Domain of unknown function (DUF1905)
VSATGAVVAGLFVLRVKPRRSPDVVGRDRRPPRRATIRGMRVMRFGAGVVAGPRGSGIIAVPFDPDETWGAKAAHHVNGTVNGCRVRVTIAAGDGGWAFPLSPSRMRDLRLAVGSGVLCELAPEGPQRGDLADDIAAALQANPGAGAFFDTLAQFYRRAYLRYIDATTRRPDLRAARIAEVTDLLAKGVKERPRSLQQSHDPPKTPASPQLPTDFTSRADAFRLCIAAGHFSGV